MTLGHGDRLLSRMEAGRKGRPYRRARSRSQYIQGLCSALTWACPALPCAGKASAAAPRLHNTRARTRIPSFARTRTVPVMGSRTVVSAAPPVRMLTRHNDIRVFIGKVPSSVTSTSGHLRVRSYTTVHPRMCHSEQSAWFSVRCGWYAPRAAGSRAARAVRRGAADELSPLLSPGTSARSLQQRASRRSCYVTSASTALAIDHH